MGELSLEEAGAVRHRTVTWTDPLVGAALARDLSGLEYLRVMLSKKAAADFTQKVSSLTCVKGAAESGTTISTPPVTP